MDRRDLFVYDLIVSPDRQIMLENRDETSAIAARPVDTIRRSFRSHFDSSRIGQTRAASRRVSARLCSSVAAVVYAAPRN